MSSQLYSTVTKPPLGWIWPFLIILLYFLYLSNTLTFTFVGKVMAAMLLLLGFIGLLFARYRAYELSISERYLLFSFALFSFISIVSFFYWPSTRLSQMQLEDYCVFIMLIPLYLLLRQFSFNIVVILVGLAFVSFMLGVLSVAQYIAMESFNYQVKLTDNRWSHMWGRPSGGVNPMRYGAISLILASFSLNGFLLVGSKSKWLRVFLVMSSIMGLIACYLADSRSSFVAIPALILMYGVYIFKAGNPKNLMLLAVVGVFLIVGLSQNERVQRIANNVEYYQNGNANTPLGSRFDMFKAATILIKERPLWGYGLGGYLEGGKQVRKAHPYLHQDVGTWSNPHNEILLVMVEKGAVGLISLILLFSVSAYLFYKALKGSEGDITGQYIRFYSFSGLCLLLVYAVVGQSVALFQHDVFNHFFCLVVLFFASQIRAVEYQT